MLAAVIGAAPSASATTVPSAPSGWTTAYSDSFSGAAGTGVDSSWTYDTGTQYSGTGCTANYGTGEVESNTSSTANVSEDGSGHLNITAVKSGSSWTSGRIETTSDNFEAPAGGEMEVSASIKQPNPSSRRRVLAGLLDARLRVPVKRGGHVGHDGLLELAVHR